MTTLSSHDRAVGTFFPLAAAAGGELTLGPDDYPEYGGTGAFGVQGTEPTVAHEILAATSQYRFAPGTTYNIESVIDVRSDHRELHLMCRAVG